MANDATPTGAAATDTPSSATPATTTPASTTTTPATAAPTATPTGFTYQEDRSNWIPKHRFDEVNTRAERVRELEAANADLDRKFKALAGVTPADPNSQRAEQIRDAFFNLPGMARFRKLVDLPDEEFDALLSTPKQAQQATQAEVRQWQREGNKNVDYISTGIAEALGVETLDTDQKVEVRTLLSKWLKDKAASEIQTTGRSQTIERYEDGDQTLLDEFREAYTKRWVDPARRQTTARNINRTRPVPSSTGRSSAPTQAMPDLKGKTMDERIDAGLNLLKERGYQFGR